MNLITNNSVNDENISKELNELIDELKNKKILRIQEIEKEFEETEYSFFFFKNKVKYLRKIPNVGKNLWNELVLSSSNFQKNNKRSTLDEIIFCAKSFEIKFKSPETPLGFYLSHRLDMGNGPYEYHNLSSKRVADIFDKKNISQSSLEVLIKFHQNKTNIDKHFDPNAEYFGFGSGITYQRDFVNNFNYLNEFEINHKGQKIFFTYINHSDRPFAYLNKIDFKEYIYDNYILYSIEKDDKYNLKLLNTFI